MITLITGGIKSGKSTRALERAKESFSFPATFIATAVALDDELRLRIARHQEERREYGDFTLIEEALRIDTAIEQSKSCVLFDCLTMWVNNIMYSGKEAEFEVILDAFTRAAKKRNTIIVTNETGLGNIPFDETTRRYNMFLSEANKRCAREADTVELMVSGIPLRVK
ncbi:bifunctional adenosylcobinamide kinase/adenosylcobinamide-phosphate guanylyltransferase [Breznakiellaceae bacterium SP9]